jgi:hypothetical protein
LHAGVVVAVDLRVFLAVRLPEVLLLSVPVLLLEFVVVAK